MKTVKIYKIQINYKSGIKVIGWFSLLKFNTAGSELVSIEYRSYGGAQVPYNERCTANHINVAAIESIWTLEEKDIEEDLGN